MNFNINPYNDYIPQFIKMFGGRDYEDVSGDPIMPQMLAVIGDVSNLRVLDAGCGDGYVARVLQHRGANVTAIDIAAALPESACYIWRTLSTGLPYRAGRPGRGGLVLSICSTSIRLGARLPFDFSVVAPTVRPRFCLSRHW